MNKNNIICFDFETGGLDIKTLHPIQVAALAINPRTLVIEPGSEFVSMMRPTGPKEVWANQLDKKALEINKKTIEEIDAAPDVEQVWKNFVQHIHKYALTKKIYDMPVACGMNIINFDIPIAERLCRQYNVAYHKEKDEVVLFHPRDKIDLLNIINLFFENSNDLPNFKMDTLRDYFGISRENSHDALVDVRQTAQIVIRFMLFCRNIAAKSKFAGAFK